MAGQRAEHRERGEGDAARPAYCFWCSANDLCVSSADERRLFTKTSGDVSLKMWLLARRRRIRAAWTLSGCPSRRG